jgi:hypothetical protein
MYGVIWEQTTASTQKHRALGTYGLGSKPVGRLLRCERSALSGLALRKSVWHIRPAAALPHIPELRLALLEVGGDGFHLVG